VITRIKIDGFKNLKNVDIFFDTFTCIAGTNAVGKSNLFDAIRFLANLADKTIIEAFKLVRNKDQASSEIRDTFFKIGNQHTDTISFEVEMIIPQFVLDRFG